MAALGPLVDTPRHRASRASPGCRPSAVDYLRRANGTVRGGVADGRPALARDVHLAEAILALSGTTNGEVAVQGWRALEKRTGVRLADLAEERAGERITLRRHPGAAAGGDHLAGVVRQRDRRAALLAVRGQRRAQEAVAHADRADALLPRPRLDRRVRRGAARLPAAAGLRAALRRRRGWARTGRPEITVRYLTPHSKWSIHSEYQDNLHMLRLFRGGPVIWMSPADAAKIGVADNDWIEAFNRNGVVACRAVVTHRMPEGTVFMYHAKDRHLMTPKSEISGWHGGGDNSLTRLVIKPTHMIGGYGQLSYGVQLLRPDRQPARRDHRDPPPLPGGGVLMRVMAQSAMVMNLDKCIGCHTCSVTCKQVWTNRPGIEYVYFNNVETKPGIGYPKRYEDQRYWHGGWTLDGKGRLQLRAGGRLRKLLSIFYNPDLPSIDDYGDPWTYDLRRGESEPTHRPLPFSVMQLVKPIGTCKHSLPQPRSFRVREFLCPLATRHCFAGVLRAGFEWCSR